MPHRVVQGVGAAPGIGEIQVDVLGEALGAEQRTQGAAALEYEALALLVEQRPGQALQELFAEVVHR